MNKLKYLLLLMMMGVVFVGCGESGDSGEQTDGHSDGHATDGEHNGHAAEEADFQYQTEQFADLRILRYKLPGWELLTVKEKTLLYYLYEAALSGRDIIYDQNYKHNLVIRRTLENIIKTYSGEKSGAEWDQFITYTKRVYFANGIHHHYSTKKFLPEFSKDYFSTLVEGSDANAFPLTEGESVSDLVTKLTPVMFDPGVDFKRVNKDAGVDKITASANNYYEGVTEAEVEAFYKAKADPNDPEPVSWGLNSKLVKENGEIVEKVWKVGGMYGSAIEKIAYWLDKAATVAENDNQEKALKLLSEYYKTGDLKKFDEYNVAWVKDVESKIDVINGFIEVYGDPLGYRGAFESVVQVRDPEASKRIAAIGAEAQWFEDNSSIMDEHKKANVKGISARVINVAMESGDASPSTPIGINLPNANWIRATHGSKSVNLANIVSAYDESSKSSGVLEEFAHSEEEIALAKLHGALADNLHTDMHEVIGHASGVINEGIGTPKETLKQYSSTLEEGRADLVALYYMMDQKLIDIGVMETLDVGKEAYNSYIKNGLMLQLRRLEVGEDIEEDHMRNRQLVAKWAFEKGKADNVIEQVRIDGKTYFVINDYEKLRDLFGQLLREIQRIKSEGDFEAGEALVEGYGVKVDQAIHQEVLDRVESLNIAPYSGFINPKLVPVMDEAGNISDVKVEYPKDFLEQHMEYGTTHSFLPDYN